MIGKKYECNDCGEIFSEGEVGDFLFCIDCGGRLELYHGINQDEKTIIEGTPNFFSPPSNSFKNIDKELNTRLCYNCKELKKGTTIKYKIIKIISKSSESYGAMVKTKYTYLSDSVNSFCCQRCLKKRQIFNLSCNLLIVASFVLTFFFIWYSNDFVPLRNFSTVLPIIFMGVIFTSIPAWLFLKIFRPLAKTILKINSIKCEPGWKFTAPSWIDDNKFKV